MLKMSIIGSLGADCSTNFHKEKRVINFNVAVNEKWVTGEGEQKEKTTWISCSYWNDKTKVDEYLKKGTNIYVEGTPDVRTFQDSKGQTQAQLVLKVTDLILLSSNKKDANTQTE